MKKTLLFFFALVSGYMLISCNGQSKTGTTDPEKSLKLSSLAGYTWTELTDSAPFPKSYNFQLFSLHDTLWAFHPEGNWFSTDGAYWTKSDLSNCIGNLAFLDYVIFKDAVYGLGHFEGNIEKFNLAPKIYISVDSKTWTMLSGNSNLPNRFFYHPFVFSNKIWIVGGSNGVNEFSDIWNSEDGVNWIKQADNLPFGKRAGSQFVILHDKIYMLNNDVWSSADGINWRLETKEIIKGEDIFGYAAVEYDNQIWLLGCNRNGIFKSEILKSKDGRSWIQQRAPWTPRGGIAACVYKQKIFITGGKYGGPGIAGQTEFVYSNDVWSLERK